jgi:hypothetical protein
MTSNDRGAFEDLAAPEGLARMLRGIEAGQDTTVLAGQDGKLPGYGSRHHGETPLVGLRVPASPRILLLMSYDVSGVHD